MKRKKMFIFTVISMLFLISCSQEEDVIYSCDKTTDTWVKDHLTEIRKMSRTQWKNLDPNLGIAVYRAFSDEQKKEFWKEKFKEVQNMDWSEDELLHIQNAEYFVFSHDFIFLERKLTEEENDELDLYFYKWMKYAEENFEWDIQLAYAIVATGYSLNNDKKNPIKNPYTAKRFISTTTEDFGTCDCNPSFIIPCGFISSISCQSVNCKDTPHGCGWLMAQSCTGVCLLEQ